MRFRTCRALGLLLVVAESKPASAAFHLIKVKEVFAGSGAHPNAQYVLLQAWAASQNAVTGHSVLTFDAAGAPTGTFTFLGPVSNGANQMMILVATADAATIFNLTADLTMTALLSPAGGKVCWDGSTPDDCVAWGNYTGSATGVGTPFNQDVGLIPGYAARRRLDICLAIANLDACDDTDDGENDFITAIPQPITNMGDFGTTPPATCGNGTLEGLEGCDDNNTTGGDGCSAICHLEPAPLAPASLLVDVTPNVPGTSNVNGVFEPGESVRIEPTWTNGDPGNLEVRAQIANFMGPTTGSPPFPFYMISDGAAYYGVLLPSETKPCDADSDCYRVFADATNRPAQHWDASVDEILSNFGVKTWTLHVGDSFTDVDPNIVADPYYPFIETIFHFNVTAGCLLGDTFCPTANNLRQEMAVFLLKVSQVSGYVPPACTPPGIFSDVPCPSLYADWIEDLSIRGVTAGCSSDPGPPPTVQYCPDRDILRSEMAVFLLKMSQPPGYVPPACTPPGIFSDVPCPSLYADWIEDLYTRGITVGCSSDPGPPPTIQFCPDNKVTRQEMAVFLTKTFSLVLYGP